MKFISIEFKNLFAYGEQVHKIEYADSGKMTLIKGITGAGKSAILSLPCLLLYGRLKTLTKNPVANRVNKHGWMRGTIIKGEDTFVIERGFAPNSLDIWKNDEQIDFFGASDAEDYIQKNILDFPLPLQTFSNMITISMRRFKSFLSMSPTDRKQLLDELFDVSIVMAVAEQLKADAKELGNSINGDNGTLFSLNQTMSNATQQLAQIQAKNAAPEDAGKIGANNKQIETLNAQILQYNEAGKIVTEKNMEAQTLLNSKFSEITAKNTEISEINNVIRTVNSKIGLYNQSKCPTCATPFTGKAFDDLKQQLADFAEKKQGELKIKQTELLALQTEYQDIQTKIQKIGQARQKVDNGIYQTRLNINNLLNENRLITERAKASAEYGAVENIINSTKQQIDAVKNSINEKTVRLSYVQQLQKVYSLDGVLGLMVENWVPSLNDEIAENLSLLNFPYILSFDKKLNATVKDFGVEVPIETLSEGEQTRLNVVTILALVKVIKKRMPSLNVMSFDETISTLDPGTSELLLTILSNYAEEQGLNIIVVSHTDLSLEMFDEIIEVEKNGRFSTFHIKTDVGI